MFDVNTSLIRFWEKEFDIIKPQKNKKGNRLFTPEDVKNFQIIYHLVKERGFTLQGAKDKLKGNKESVSNDAEIVATLQKDNLFGTQFHPEKSANIGLKLISNYLNI